MGEFPELDDYQVLHQVSEGSFSAVFLAKHKHTGEQAAIKRLHAIVTPDRVVTELLAMQIAGGKGHVCRVLDFKVHAHFVSFVVPYFEHDAFAYYFRRFNLKDMKVYMKALLTALKRIHSFGIIHRDVKPANFLHKYGTDEFMLIDFGLVDVVSLETVNLKKPVLVTEANRFLSRACRQRIPAASRAGTKGFRAPEVLLRHQNQTCAVDIWSAGMIFLCLLSGKYPISTPTDDLDALVEISQLIGTRRLQEAAKNLDRDVVLPQDIVHSGWRSVLNKLEGRTDLEIDDCSLDLLNRLLDPDMYSRVTASEALQHPFFSED